MENPACWSETTKQIDEVIRQHDKDVAKGICGLSLQATLGQFVEARVSGLRAELSKGCDLVESAFSHVSHGGPTREEAEKWVKSARRVLKGA